MPLSQIRTHNLLALVTATFILLSLLRNPISLLLFDRTIDIMITSFSRPWNPSTVETSTGKPSNSGFDLTSFLIRFTYALYGLITPMFNPFDSPTSFLSSRII